MIPINLIRDRAQRPPTTAERLTPVLVGVLILLYAGTVALVVGLDIWALRSVRFLERQIRQEQELLETAEEHPANYSEADLELIGSLRQMLRLFQERQYWGQKLAALGGCLPEGLVISHLQVGGEGEVEIRGYASSHTRQTLEKIGDFVSRLKESPTFRAGLKNIDLESVSTPAVSSEGERFEFVVKAAAWTEGGAMSLLPGGK